jgi:hypothetical protein
MGSDGFRVGSEGLGWARRGLSGLVGRMRLGAGGRGCVWIGVAGSQVGVDTLEWAWVAANGVDALWKGAAGPKRAGNGQMGVERMLDAGLGRGRMDGWMSRGRRMGSCGASMGVDGFGWASMGLDGRRWVWMGVVDFG